MTITGRCSPAVCVTLVAITTACDKPEDTVVCVPLGPAVVVSVRDSITNSPAATGARGAAEFSGTVDSLIVNGDLQMISHAHAHPGSFAVRIEKPGYAPWAATLVAPTGGACGSPGAHADARLQPNPVP